MDQRRVEIRDILTQRIEILKGPGDDVNEGLPAFIHLKQGNRTPQPELEDEGDDAEDQGQTRTGHHDGRQGVDRAQNHADSVVSESGSNPCQHPPGSYPVGIRCAVVNAAVRKTAGLALPTSSPRITTANSFH